MLRLLLRTPVLTAALLAACTGDQPSVILKGERFVVSVADEPHELQRGLMFVDQLPAREGMLFIFPDQAPRAFWMKNTRVSLDILYFDRQLQLVSVQHNIPPCRADPCAVYPSAGPARYVLELNGGVAERLGVRRGDFLQLKLDS